MKEDLMYKTFVENQLTKYKEKKKKKLSENALYDYLMKKEFTKNMFDNVQEKVSFKGSIDNMKHEYEHEGYDVTTKEKENKKDVELLKLGRKIRVIGSNDDDDEGYIVRCKNSKNNKHYIVVLNHKLYSFTESEIEVLENVAPLSYEDTKRHFLFFLYPDSFVHNILLDKVSLYSTTDCQTADFMTQQIIQEFSLKFRSTILDATACVGGNTLSFYKYFRTVIAIEENEHRFNLLSNNVKVMETYLKSTKFLSNNHFSHNIRTKFSKKAPSSFDNKKQKYTKTYSKSHVSYENKNMTQRGKNSSSSSSSSFYYPVNQKYEWRDDLPCIINQDNEPNATLNNEASKIHIENKIYLYNESCLDFLKKIQYAVDVIFFDPPRGGVDYKLLPELNIYLDDIPIANICNDFRDKCNMGMVIKVPLNFHLKDFLNTIEPYFVCDDCRKFYNVILLILKKKKEKKL